MNPVTHNDPPLPNRYWDVVFCARRFILCMLMICLYKLPQFQVLLSRWSYLRRLVSVPKYDVWTEWRDVSLLRLLLCS